MSRPRMFLTNLQAPMPLRRKLWLLARNNWRRAYRLATTGQSCCGHHGEPGC